MPSFYRNLGLKFAFAACASLNGASAAWSAEPPQMAPLAGWTLSATPYSWLTFLDGDTTVRGRTAEIDIDPIEVLEHLDAVPWMSYAEARRGPLAFYNDIVFAKMGIDVSGVRTLGGVTLDAALGLDLTLTIIELGAAYEIARWGAGGGVKDANAFARTTAIDLLAGARYWRQEVDISLAVTATLDTSDLEVSGARAIARSGGVDWVDPVIGARVRHQLAPGQELQLRGDIGGFDVGSKFSWNVLGAYSWHMFDRHGVSYSGVLGYRLLSVDYEQGAGTTRYEYDVLQHGPLTGLILRF